MVWLQLLWKQQVMCIKQENKLPSSACQYQVRQLGVTLIELIIFIVLISFSLGAMMAVFNYSTRNSVDPIVNVRMLEIAQSQLDRVLARKYAENTPSGGVPACAPCTAIGTDSGEVVPDSFDDIDDFDGYGAVDASGYSYVINVVSGAPGLAGNPVSQRITVTVTAPIPTVSPLSLTSYRVNF